MSYSPNPFVTTTPEQNTLAALDGNLDAAFTDGVKLVDRNLTLNGRTVTVTVDNYNKLVTFTTQAGDWSACQVGDGLEITGPPFSDVNAGYFKITAVAGDGSSVTAQRIAGVTFSCTPESKSVSANSQVVAMTAMSPLPSYNALPTIAGYTTASIKESIKSPFKTALVAFMRSISSLLESQTTLSDGALSNSWVSYDGGTTYNQPGYYKNPFGEVRLQGLIKNGVVSSGSTGTVFTLPAGYRPAKQLIFGVETYNGASIILGEVRVLPTGDVRVSSGSTTFVSLEGISFRAFA